VFAALVVWWAQPAAQVQVSQPYAGLTYINRWVETPRRVHLHIAQIDLATPGLRFKVSPPGGERETLRQSTLAFLRQEQAQLAINGHFFLPFPSADRAAWVIGLAASEGRVYSAFESPEQRYALVANAPAINIDRENRASIVHHDSSRHRRPRDHSAVPGRRASGGNPRTRRTERLLQRQGVDRGGDCPHGDRAVARPPDPHAVHRRCPRRQRGHAIG
jgi:hypothetical protein